MIVTSSGINNGIIEDKYGKRGTQLNQWGIPTCSLPFSIVDAPKAAVSYAIMLEDKDAYPVSGGFAWVHWTAADIVRTVIGENESLTAADFVQGVNSWTSMQGGLKPHADCSCYGGMCPPNAPHVYELHVYALDCKLNLANGFFMNEMYRKMDGHVLAQYTLKGVYND